MHRLEKLVLSSIQLDIQEFINQVTDDFAVPLLQVLGFAVPNCLGSKLLEIVDHLL